MRVLNNAYIIFLNESIVKLVKYNVCLKLGSFIFSKHRLFLCWNDFKGPLNFLSIFTRWKFGTSTFWL